MGERNSNTGMEPGARTPFPAFRSQQGFVIVVVLLVTALLVAVVVEFSYGVYLATARAGNFMNGQKAGLLAGRGVEFAGAAVEEMLRQSPFIAIEEGGLVFTETEGDMAVTIRVVDELGKLSLRTVYEKNGVRNDKAYDGYSRLLRNLGVEDARTLEEALADWIDGDDEPRLHGAEAADYQRAYRKAFRPANAYLRSVDDLLMLKGYGPEAFALISPFVSVYNAGGLVNINTAPEEVLMALSDDMTENLARNIIKARKDAPFKDRSDIMKVPGFESAGFGLQDRITVKSDTFRIYSRVTSGDIARQAEAVYRINSGFLYWREM